MNQFSHTESYSEELMADIVDHHHMPRKLYELDVETARRRIERNYLQNIASEMRGIDGRFRLKRRQKETGQLEALHRYFN